MELTDSEDEEVEEEECEEEEEVEAPMLVDEEEEELEVTLVPVDGKMHEEVHRFLEVRKCREIGTLVPPKPAPNPRSISSPVPPWPNPSG